MANGMAKDKSDKLSWKSDVYFGGIVRKAEGLAAEDSAEYARLSKLLAAKDPSIFETPRLVSFILDRSPADFSQKVFAFAAVLDPASLSVRQAAGVVACLAEAEGFMPGANNPFLRFEPVIEKRILPAMSKARDGSLLATDPATVDVAAQARAGAALIAWGSLRYSEASTGMGQALLQGLFSLADDSGMLPASLALKDGAVSGKQGNLAPESVYPFVADNPWYPREVSFFKQAGAGTWAWTCSPDLRWEGGAGQASISASWPQGMAHFLTIFGIAPFSQIQIYDIPYSPDSEFESYNVSGFSYSRSARTLYLKMKHKAEKEYVRLTFQ